MNQHLPETADEIPPIPDWMISQPKETSMTTRYVPRLERAQKIAIAFLVGALLAAGVIATVNAQAPRAATITFTRPTAYTDGTSIPTSVVVTYNVFQGAKGSTTKTKVATIGSTSTTISTGLTPGETCWQVSAIANGVESAPSNEGCKTFAFPATETVTITVT